MSPTPSPDVDLSLPWVVSPGIEGFAMFFVLALLTIFLIRSMLKHVRKANFQAAEREEELYGPLTTAEGERSEESGVRDRSSRAESEPKDRSSSADASSPDTSPTAPPNG